MRYVRSIPLIFVAASVATLTPASADTRFYRYDLPTPSCFPDIFKDEISPEASHAGPSVRVETDALGRPTKWESLRDGKPVFVYTAQFKGKAIKMSGWQILREGVSAGSYRCLSDASGALKRFEILD